MGWAAMFYVLQVDYNLCKDWGVFYYETKSRIFMNTAFQERVRSSRI